MTPQQQTDRQGARVSIPFLRVLSLIGGLVAIPVAIMLPILFISNELNEAQGARQLGGHPLTGSILAVVIGIGFAVIVAFIAWVLLKFAIKGRI